MFGLVSATAEFSEYHQKQVQAVSCTGDSGEGHFAAENCSCDVTLQK